MSSPALDSPAERKGRLLSSIKRACTRKGKQRYGRPMSANRLQTLQGLLVRGANRIWSLGFHIDDISKVEDFHLHALAADLKGAGFSDSTTTAYLKAFEALSKWQGRKSNVTPQGWVRRSRRDQASEHPVTEIE